MIKKFKKSDILFLKWFLDKTEYKPTLIKYLMILTYFVKRVINALKSGVKINRQELERDTNIPFSVPIIREMIEWLISKKRLKRRFPSLIGITNFKKEVQDFLNEHPNVSNQELYQNFPNKNQSTLKKYKWEFHKNR